ncbi:MAG: type II toxin-antitoxin system Phd/YefM family antitoxin [Campylobacterota bacterium]|nr:type II toxin-antitoxin system Phd/YefM family antitoxin [Campylobacterota bacterium]
MANDLKTRGVKLLDEALQQDDEAIISVRGKPKYVVMNFEHYNYLRECELEAALIEARKEIEEGKAKTLTADEHIKALHNDL